MLVCHFDIVQEICLDDTALIMHCPYELGLLLQIREASWAVFKALPMVTSVGVTALNGLTTVYARGLPTEKDGSSGSFYVYTNETSSTPVYYRENVSEETGTSLGPPAVQKFPHAIHDTTWFQKAITYPINDVSWTIGRSLTSKYRWVVNFLWIDSSVEATRCTYR